MRVRVMARLRNRVGVRFGNRVGVRLRLRDGGMRKVGFRKEGARCLGVAFTAAFMLVFMVGLVTFILS